MIFRHGLKLLQKNERPEYKQRPLSKTLPETKRINEIKMFLKPFAALSDYPAIYQSTQNRSKLDSFKTAEADKKKRHGNCDDTAGTIIYCFGFIDIETVS